MPDCSKCLVKDKCKEWKNNQIGKGKSNKIRKDLKEILESYCPIKDWAFTRAIRGGR